MDIGSPGAGAPPPPRPGPRGPDVRGPSPSNGAATGPSSTPVQVGTGASAGGPASVQALLDSVGLPSTPLREAIVTLLRDAELPLDRAWIGQTERLARKFDLAESADLRALVDLLERKLPVTAETVRDNRHLLGREFEWAKRWGQTASPLDPDLPDETVARWLESALPVEARLAASEEKPFEASPGDESRTGSAEERSARLAAGLRGLAEPPELDVPWSSEDGCAGWVRIQEEPPEQATKPGEAVTHVRMSLETPNLSRLGIDLHFVAGQVTLQIDLHDPEHARWLEPRLQELRTALEARGMKVAGVGTRVRRVRPDAGETGTSLWG